jgi:hypothetical protein
MSMLQHPRNELDCVRRVPPATRRRGNQDEAVQAVPSQCSGCAVCKELREPRSSTEFQRSKELLCRTVVRKKRYIRVETEVCRPASQAHALLGYELDTAPRAAGVAENRESFSALMAKRERMIAGEREPFTTLETPSWKKGLQSAPATPEKQRSEHLRGPCRWRARAAAGPGT